MIGVWWGQQPATKSISKFETIVLFQASLSQFVFTLTLGMHRLLFLAEYFAIELARIPLAILICIEQKTQDHNHSGSNNL
jgi:hypothetical protein